MPKVVPVYFAPDIDTAWSVNPGALAAMQNFAPLQLGAYGSVANATYLANVTGHDHLSAYMFRQVDGSVRFLTGRVSNIDEYDSSATRTNRGTGYNASTTDWAMAAWGNQIIACNYLDATQSSTGAGFTALSGAPKARLIAANLSFVILADVDDSGSNVFSDMVWWSALQNPNSWTVSLATQAGNIRILSAPGPIRAIVAFQNSFVVFKDNSVHLMEYTGPQSFIFQERVISNRIGCVSSKSPILVDGKLYFLHTSGFYEFDGQAIRNIGLPVFQSFVGEANYINPAAATSYIPVSAIFNDGITKTQTAGDDIEGIVWFKTSYTVTNFYVLIMYGYNVRTGRWGRIYGTLDFTAGDKTPPFVRASTADIQAFKSDMSGRILMVWNGVPNVTVFRYPIASGGKFVSSSYTTGVFGSNDGSQMLRKFYWRTLEGTTDDILMTITTAGYTSENKNKTNGTATATINTEFDYADVRLTARYHTVSVAWNTGSKVLFAGVAADLDPTGTR